MTKLGNINSQTDMVDSVNGQTGAVIVSSGTPGGAINEKLAKASATDYDTKWLPPWAMNAYVNTAAPAGSPTSGDLWWDSDEPSPAIPGQELAYNQITAMISVTATSAAAPTLVIEGTARSYDGSPVIVEFYTPFSYLAGVGTMIYNLWDASTDTARMGACVGPLASGNPVHLKRKVTPTAGSHTYRIVAWNSGAAGTNQIYAGNGGTDAYTPAFIRVTRV